MNLLALSETSGMSYLAYLCFEFSCKNDAVPTLNLHVQKTSSASVSDASSSRQKRLDSRVAKTQILDTVATESLLPAKLEKDSLIIQVAKLR